MSKADSTREYLKGIGRVRLLTADEEITLGHRIQRMVAIRETIPEAEWTKEQRRTVRVGERAKAKMVESNLRLVVSVAKKWLHVTSTLTIDDLIQEGSMGLIRAAEKFDPEKGYKFSTYAMWWIRQAIGRGISYTSRTIRLPGNGTASLRKAREFLHDYKRDHGKLPTVDQIADHCGVTPSAMQAYLNHMNDCKSLDAQAHINDRDSSSIIDFIVDPNSLDKEDMQLDMQELEILLTCIEKLKPQHQEVLKKRFGLTGECDEMSFVEIGKTLGISRERTRQIEKNAINALKLQLIKVTNLGKIYA